jgi:hypothetical protein
VAAAFEEIGLADYVFDLSPDQIQSCLVRLDAMVGRLKGLFIHWPFSSSPSDTNLDTDTRCPNYANECIFLNLAIAIAPSYGKQISSDTRKNASDAYDTVVSWSASLPPTRQTPAMLSGSGNKPWRGSRTINIEPTIEPITVKGNDLIF